MPPGTMRCFNCLLGITESARLQEMGVFRGGARAYWLEKYGADRVAKEDAIRQGASCSAHRRRRQRARRMEELLSAGSRQAISAQLAKQALALREVFIGPARPQHDNPALDACGNGPKVAEAIRLALQPRPPGWTNPYGTADELPELKKSNVAKGKHKDAMKQLSKPANAAELAGGRSLDLNGGHTHRYDMNTIYRQTCIRHGFARIIVYSPLGPSVRGTGLPDTSKAHAPKVHGGAYIEAFPRPPEGYPEEQGQANVAGGHALG